MSKIYILSCLTPSNIPEEAISLYYFSTRKLFSQEIKCIRYHELKRYYLKSLTQDHEREFFTAFDQAWARVIEGRGPADPFWRNSVSSKMQEWENGVGYLAASLFSLSKDPLIKNIDLIVLPDSVEEALVWRAWALSLGFDIARDEFSFWKCLVQEAENILRALRLSVLFLIKKWRASPKPCQPAPGSVLCVTLFYRQVFDKEVYEDQFFSQLHKEAARCGNEVYYLADAIDALKSADYPRMGQKDWPTSIYQVLTWNDMVAGLWALWQRLLSFKGCIFNKVDFSALLAWHARRARYDYNLRAEFFYRAVRRLCGRCAFSKMLYAYEGNVYEHAIVQAFRQAGGGLIDAYSHAVLYPLNLKLYLSKGEVDVAPEPDRYLICGDYARDALLKIRRIKAELVSVCSLRDIPRGMDLSKAKATEVLIVLDGVWSSRYLLDWLYANQAIFDGYKVRIRPHPNVSGEELLNQCAHYQEGVFTISTRSLQEDLSDAICVVYRQSSVGIMALMNKIPIIHLAIDLPLVGDPLEGFMIGKISVQDAQGLKEALKNNNQGIQDVQKYFVLPSESLKKPFMDISCKK